MEGCLFHGQHVRGYPFKRGGHTKLDFNYLSNLNFSLLKNVNLLSVSKIEREFQARRRLISMTFITEVDIPYYTINSIKYISKFNTRCGNTLRTQVGLFAD